MEEKDLQEETENTNSAAESPESVETEKTDLSAAETPDEMAVFKEADLFDTPEPEKTSDSAKNIERLLDVEMNVTVRFGKTEIPLREAVNFGVGSMIELNRSVDEPVDLLVNNFLFARGEVVVIDGYYGVRVTEIGSPEERSQTFLSRANN